MYDTFKEDNTELKCCDAFKDYLDLIQKFRVSKTDIKPMFGKQFPNILLNFQIK